MKAEKNNTWTLTKCFIFHQHEIVPCPWQLKITLHLLHFRLNLYLNFQEKRKSNELICSIQKYFFIITSPMNLANTMIMNYVTYYANHTTSNITIWTIRYAHLNHIKGFFCWTTLPLNITTWKLVNKVSNLLLKIFLKAQNSA